MILARRSRLALMPGTASVGYVDTFKGWTFRLLGIDGQASGQVRLGEF